MKYLYVFVFVMLAGCQILSNEDTVDPSDTPINFANLEIGQHSVYRAFKGDNHYQEEATFNYLEHTLTVEVVNKTDSGFVFTERVRQIPINEYHFADTTTYHVSIADDSLIVSTYNTDYIKSNLFVLSRYRLPLQPITNNEIQLDGIVATSENLDGFQIGFLADHKQLGYTYDQLNVMIDWTPTYADGPGHLTAYSQEAGIVRAFTLNPWTSTAIGWDLMQ